MTCRTGQTCRTGRTKKLKEKTMEKRVFWNIELSGMIRAFTDCRIGTGYALAIDKKLWAMRPKEVEEIPITMAQAAAIASVVIAQVEEDQ